MRRMVFYRDYHGYTGGHGKVRDYLDHVSAHPQWCAAVYLTPDSDRGGGNPFCMGADLAPAWPPQQADALFLGGMDWAALPAVNAAGHRPIINLVQHVRHADPALGLRQFLCRRAIRVCVSTAVAQAILATGEVNGPVRVIPAAVDVPMLQSLGAASGRGGVFIDAVKQPHLGAAVAAALAAVGVPAHLHHTRLPRADYLAAMASAGIVVTLPDPTEGFYLPGIEALALGCALVQYDCLGSRDYLRDGDNALVPAPTVEAIATAVLQLRGDASLRARLCAGGRVTAARFGLASERASVHALLEEMDALWLS